VIADKLTLIETDANAGQTKQSVIALARCCAALALYTYVGKKLALTPDVPVD
jgi:hypothetical protein